jgi:hypothetical protein
MVAEGINNAEQQQRAWASQTTAVRFLEIEADPGELMSSILRLGPLRSSNLAPLLIDILRHLGRRAKLRPAQIQPVN